MKTRYIVVYDRINEQRLIIKLTHVSHHVVAIFADQEKAEEYASNMNADIEYGMRFNFQ